MTFRRTALAGVLACAAAAAAVAGALFLPGALTSRAVQNPNVYLDMVLTGTTYDGTTNVMTVGTIDPCLAIATANPATHVHATHLIIQNVEDLVGWQARFNYIGDKMRVQGFNATPFSDMNTLQSVGFTNIPIDSVSSVHRDVTAAANIPAAPPDGTNTPQTALVGATYNLTPTAAVSPDTPPKSPADDSSYSAPSGGVLGQITLQVVGNESGNTMTMDIDDDMPNPPGTDIVTFNGTGTTTTSLAESALHDGAHVEGGTVCAAGGTATATATAPAATPTRTATAAATPTRTATANPTAAATPTRTATATPTAAATATRTATATPTAGAGTGTATATATATPTAGAGTGTATATASPTATATATVAAGTGTATATATPTPGAVTATATAGATASPTTTATPTATPGQVTATPTATPTAPAATPTATPTAQPGGDTCDGLAATKVGTDDDEVIFGTSGRDVIVAKGDNDIILGMDGDDVICAGSGKDLVVGGKGNDRIFGQSGDDVLLGGQGDDFIDGGSGNDLCIGGPGADTFANCERITGRDRDDTDEHEGDRSRDNHDEDGD